MNSKKKIHTILKYIASSKTIHRTKGFNPSGQNIVYSRELYLREQSKPLRNRLLCNRLLSFELQLNYQSKRVCTHRLGIALSGKRYIYIYKVDSNIRIAFTHIRMLAQSIILYSNVKYLNKPPLKSSLSVDACVKVFKCIHIQWHPSAQYENCPCHCPAKIISTFVTQ